MQKVSKIIEKENPPARKQGGMMEGMDRDAGEPAYKIHTPTRQVVLNLERRGTQDFTVA